MMQHVSFAVAPESQARIRQRLEAKGIEYQGPIEVLPGVYSVYVFDPNGIRLEFSCQPGDGEGEPRIVPGITMSKREALAELKTLSADQHWLEWATQALPE
jgi:hypothetical protein